MNPLPVDAARSFVLHAIGTPIYGLFLHGSFFAGEWDFPQTTAAESLRHRNSAE